jgi:hypothetical protein
MNAITPCALPPDALLQRYAQMPGAYTDCYATTLPTAVSQTQYLEAFYTSRVFKLERAILRLVLSKPSNDAQAQQLAQGSINSFAVWKVEDRNAQQLLMRDYQGSTGSWLMTAPQLDATGKPTGTKLYFGSAVVPTRASVQQGKPQMGAVFRLLLGFHKLYTRILLRAACARLRG